MTNRILFTLICGALLCASCATSSVDAEEYYSIGTAFYDMGKYTEAEKWFERARGIKKTMNASEYNLGRIAFEGGRFSDAAKHFERLVRLDPINIMALKSAAYTEIKRGNLESAEEYYSRVLALQPDSADDGYNHALVLYAMGRYEDAEEVLNKFSYTMPENKNTLLLLARTQRAQHKVEAINNYSLWLAGNNDPLVRYEYVLSLDEATYFARAIEESRTLLKDLTSDMEGLKRSDAQWVLASLLMIADPANEDGLKELKNAVSSGFNDTDSLEALAADSRVIPANKNEIKKIILDIRAEASKKDAEEKKKETPSTNVPPVMEPLPPPEEKIPTVKYEPKNPDASLALSLPGVDQALLDRLMELIKSGDVTSDEYKRISEEMNRQMLANDPDAYKKMMDDAAKIQEELKNMQIPGQ